MTVVRISPAHALTIAAKELADQIAAQLRFTTGHDPSAGEKRSWEASLPALARDLCDAGLDKVEMVVEYQLPMTSKRADVVLAGRHPDTGDDSYVVVELKQWSSARLDHASEREVLVGGMGGGPKLHPVEQVRRYSQYIRNFLAIFETSAATIHGVAYLHNASDSSVAELFKLPIDLDGRMFTMDRRGAFQQYLLSRLSDQSGADAADRFLSSRHKPGKRLIDLAAKEIREREQFVLLDEQVIARDLVMNAVDAARREDDKEVIVITGGPGSGKSVIALSVLGELYREGYAALHATGSRAFTQTMRKVVAKGAPQLKSLFKYFNDFVKTDKNSIDVLVCDEAHRIRETSNSRWTRKDSRSDKPQVAELIGTARVPVFLLDEYQIVKPGEIGSVSHISDYAASQGRSVRQIDLDAQFRCGGSRAYEEWVVRFLGLEGDGPLAWEGDGNFTLQVVDSPDELERVIQSYQTQSDTARMTAGFCWSWSDPADGELVPDVRIGDWSHPWNAKSERAIGDAPPSSLWATDPAGISQVGCVYTAQGFEYSWNGVILGPDIVVRDGKLHTIRSENKDPAFRSRKIPDSTIDRHIRHIYKVLLTRGLRGTVIYAVDEETRQYLASVIRQTGTAP